MTPRIAVRDIAFFERPIDFVRPFRFGSVTITKAAQIFVRAEIELEDGSRSVGGSAEMMAPKWFDKRPHLSAEESAAELRRALMIARDLYLARDGFETAFGLHAARIGAQVAACTEEDIPALAAAYGPAEIDKAVLDALLRALAKNFFDGMAANVAGIRSGGGRGFFRLFGDRDFFLRLVEQADGRGAAYLHRAAPDGGMSLRHPARHA
jgi:hypothetical protein